MRPPGELIYLSERKLLDLAVHFGIDAGWSEASLAVSGSGGLRLPFMPGTGVSASAERRSERVDPWQEHRARARALEQVIAALEAKRPLLHLDRSGLPPERPPTQLDWFRFRRPLRFGVGTADSDHSVRALVLVDEHAVAHDEGPRPGLLMTGAPHHLQEPYAYDRPDDVAGGRSGSGTDELFRWLRDVWLALDADRRAGLGGPAAALFGANPTADRPAVAYEMYSLFARDDWMKPRFRDIRRTAMCEGVGIISLIAAPDGLPSVVMGSPLYVRVCTPEHDDTPEHAGSPRGRLLRRLRGAR